MKTLPSKVWEFRLAIFWFCLFSINSLATCFAASFTGPDWNNLSKQQVCLIVALMIANWTGTLMAFISKQAKRMETGQSPFSDTAFTPKPTETPKQ